MKVIITAFVHDYLVDQMKQRGFDVVYQPAMSYEDI